MTSRNELPSVNNPSPHIAHVNRILGSADKSTELLTVLLELERDPSCAALVFENVVHTMPNINYWSYYRISEAYLELGREDACFLTAAAAVAMEPDAVNWHMLRNIFHYYRKRNFFAEALHIAEKQIKKNPENPIITSGEYRILCINSGKRDAESEGSLPSRSNHRVTDEYTYVRKFQPRYGYKGVESRAHILDQIGPEFHRPPITVSLIENAEILTFAGNVLILDNQGALYEDLSVSQFPSLAMEKARSETGGTDEIEIDEAVIIADRFATANVCHFLFDHLTRLALYERAGVHWSSATVIGPEITTAYQASMTQTLGVKRYRGTMTPMRAKVRRAWVSSNCKADFRHPAHCAAEWATSFLRDGFPQATGTNNLRLFISRADAGFRHIVNETVVAEVLSEVGFQTVILSKLTYADQVKLFRHASHVVGMHGAGLTNIIFCPPEAYVLEILHPLGGSGAYALTASALDLRYSALMGSDVELDDESLHALTFKPESELGMAGRFAALNRDVVVDLTELRRWLVDSGLA